MKRKTSLTLIALCLLLLFCSSRNSLVYGYTYIKININGQAQTPTSSFRTPTPSSTSSTTPTAQLYPEPEIDETQYPSFTPETSTLYPIIETPDPDLSKEPSQPIVTLKNQLSITETLQNSLLLIVSSSPSDNKLKTTITPEINIYSNENHILGKLGEENIVNWFSLMASFIFLFFLFPTLGWIIFKLKIQ